VNPFNPQEKLQLADLLDFILFDENNKAVVNDSIYINKSKNKIEIFEDNVLLTEVDQHLKLPSIHLGVIINSKCPSSNKLPSKKSSLELQNQSQEHFEIQTKKIKSKINQDFLNLHFIPPLFGVTMLGNSHGFDPCGDCSGYILWINGRF
jgi:hypothetical protein